MTNDTPIEVLPYITGLEYDGLMIAAIVDDFQFVEDRTDEPTIHGWQVIDTVLGRHLGTDGKWGSGPGYDLSDPPSDITKEERKEEKRCTFPTLADAWRAAKAAREAE